MKNVVLALLIMLVISPLSACSENNDSFQEDEEQTTPESEHLKGFGTTNRNGDVTGWLKEIGIIPNQ